MDPRIRAKYGQKLTAPGYKEAIRQPLYDTLTFLSNNTVQLRFFTQGLGGGTKTDADTNLALNGQLSKGQKFVCDGVELIIKPGSAGGAVYTRQDVFRQNPALAAPQFANDLWALAQSGSLKIVIGGTGKPYLQDAPLLVFPAQSGLILAATADQSLAAAANQTITSDYARVAGRPYVIYPELPIEENNA